MARPKPVPQSSSSIGWPSGCSQTMSGSRSPSPRAHAAGRRRSGVRRNVGCSRAQPATAAVNSISGCVGAGPSRPSSARCPGSRRCCCPAGCGPARRRAAIIGTPWRQQQRRQEVALLAGPQRQDLRVVGRALDAAVPGPVVALAVAVVLAVGLVVLLVVGDEVAQREAVVRGDEVDARDRPAAGVLVQVGASR